MKFRATLRKLEPVDAAAFGIVTVLTLLVSVIAAATGLIADLAERLTEVGETAAADLAARAATSPATAPVTVTAVRARDLPAWSTR